MEKERTWTWFTLGLVQDVSVIKKCTPGAHSTVMVGNLPLGRFVSNTLDRYFLGRSVLRYRYGYTGTSRHREMAWLIDSGPEKKRLKYWGQIGLENKI